jgi:hypothetical protein
MNEVQSKLDFLDKMLDRNLRWVAAADAKIYPIFTIDAAMLGVLATLMRPGARWTLELMITCGLATAALLASIVCLTLASFPRLERSRRSESSLVYFAHAIRLGESEYIKRVSSEPTPALIQDLARQAYRSAEIAYLKYRAIRWAMILFFASVMPWLIAVAALYQSRSAVSVF